MCRNSDAIGRCTLISLQPCRGQGHESDDAGFNDRSILGKLLAQLRSPYLYPSDVLANLIERLNRPSGLVAISELVATKETSGDPGHYSTGVYIK